MGLHYSDLEMYKPVKEHALYKDFITPAIVYVEVNSKPVIDNAKPFLDNMVSEIMSIPQIASLFGVDPADVKNIDGGNLKNGNSPRPGAKKVEFADANAAQKRQGRGPASAGPNSHGGLAFYKPSQMKFSLAEAGVKIEKRSILSTEGEEATDFELPDGSMLWLAPDSVVEAGWVSGKTASDPTMLMRVETGILHIHRNINSKGKLFLVSNSGIRNEIKPDDAWLAAAQIGAVDKNNYPDASRVAKNHSSDYARRATIEEAKKLVPYIVADTRREQMLLQDQIREGADLEELHKDSVVSKNPIINEEIEAIPMHIPSRFEEENQNYGGRSPASLTEEDIDSFPARRAPASVAAGLDDATARSTEFQINAYVENEQCSAAHHVFKKTVERYDLQRGDRWRNKVQSMLRKKCAL